MNDLFKGKLLTNVIFRIKIKFIEREDYEKSTKKQTKLTLSGIQKSDTTYDTFTFKQNEVLMGMPCFLRFDVLELNKCLNEWNILR